MLRSLTSHNTPATKSSSLFKRNEVLSVNMGVEVANTGASKQVHGLHVCKQLCPQQDSWGAESMDSICTSKHTVNLS